MPAHIDRLRQLAKELEAELSAVDAADTASQTALAETLSDLRAALEKLDGEPMAPESLIARLRAAEADFRVSHPTVSSLVVGMIDALGQLGI